VLEQLQVENGFLRARLDDYERGKNFPSRRDHAGRMMVKEMLHFSGGTSANVGILTFASLFRDAAPWVYELGVEVCRLARQDKLPELERVISDFRRAVDMVLHSPLRELLGRGNESASLFEIIEPRLDDMLRSI
jgi:hypothetical protein